MPQIPKARQRIPASKFRSDLRATRLLKAALALERLEILLEHASLSDVAEAFAVRCIADVWDILKEQLAAEDLAMRSAA